MTRKPRSAAMARPAEVPAVAQALAHCIGDRGIVIVAGDVIATVNRAFLRVFGALPEGEPAGAHDLVGAPVAALTQREPFRAAADLWAARDGEPGRRHRCILPGGRVIEGRWHPLPSDSRRLSAVIVSDSTGEAQIRARLRQHNRALAELVATKTELVSALLHELRTPLAAALGMVQLLPESTADPLLAEALPVIARKLRRIDEVTQEIATISGIENGTVALARREVDLPALLTEVAHEAGATIEARPASGIVVGDRDRLSQVLHRLIMAVRAVGGDATAITAELIDEWWRIALPLPERHATDRLFTAGGNATALMLARAVAGRHGGRVGVETVAGTPHLVVWLPHGIRQS